MFLQFESVTDRARCDDGRGLDIGARPEIVKERAPLVCHGLVPVIGCAERLMPGGHAEAQVDDARGGRVGRRRTNQEREAKEQDSQQARGAQHGSENCGKSMQHKMNFNENLKWVEC